MGMYDIGNALPNIDIQTQTQTKVIAISVGHGVIKMVPINKNSDLLFDLHSDTIHDEPYNLTQYLTAGSQ